MAKHLQPTQKSSSVQSELMSITIGPAAHCRQLAWDLLVDFESWSKWIDKLETVCQVDAGNTGRGSQLLLKYGQEKQLWEVLYWEPLQRIDFEVLGTDKRIGYSFELKSGIDNEHTEINFSIETRFSGVNSLFSPLLDIFLKRRAIAFFKQIAVMLERRAD